MKIASLRAPLSCLAICACCLCASCVSLPKLAELPPLPAYGSQPLACSKPVNCAISVPGSYDGQLRYSVKQGNQTVQQSFPMPAEQIVSALKPALEGMNCSIVVDECDYITREQRLSVSRIVIPQIANTRLLRGSDGAYHDVLLHVAVYDPAEQAELGSVDVWGRSSTFYNLALNEAVSNLVTMEEFKNLLE